SADHDTLITTDILVEGTHFKLDYSSPWQIGWKSLAASVSDIAAMGGRPTYAVVSIGIRPRNRAYTVESLYEGIRAAADKYGVSVIGGDTVQSRLIVVNVTLMGEVPKGGAVTRKGAKPGDLIFVTGTCGDGKAGLEALAVCAELGNKRKEQFLQILAQRHLAPEPSLAAGMAARASGAASAMMDLSDGLSSDLPRLCERSKVGAIINISDVPLSEEVKIWAESFGRDPNRIALQGGEDYNLLITAHPEKAPLLVDAIRSANVRITPIGVILQRERGLLVLGRDGTETNLPKPEFEHFNHVD
ncbi:MAG TPA: thiamine-phosphate kinase, partial [bacterium]|nr:thiamine-phosphate kinase [bacterium]